MGTGTQRGGGEPGGKRSVTESLEFRRWFGDSKVVGKDGKPVVVYHGTTAPDFGAFKGDATFFTDSPSIAGGVYAEGRSELNVDAFKEALSGMSDSKVRKTVEQLQRDGALRSIDETSPDLREDLIADIKYGFDADEGMGQPSDVILVAFGVEPRTGVEGSRVVPAYLALKNPLTIDAKGEEFDAWEQGEWLKRSRDGGHDGLIIKNYDDGGYGAPGSFTSAGRHTVYVAFRPEQIKSATGNRGTFDPENPDIRLMERRAPGIPEPAPGIPQPKEPEKQEAKPAPGQPGFERRPIRPIPPEASPLRPETAGMLPKGLDTGVVIQYIPKGGGPAREGMVIHAPKGGTVDVKLDGRPGIVKLPEGDLKAIGHLKDSLMRPRSKGMTAEQSRSALGRAWADKEPGDITGKPSEGTAPFNLNHLALSPDNREKMARIWKASKDAYEKAAGRRTLEDVRIEGEELLREVGGRGTIEEAVKAGVPLGDGKFVHAARLVLAEQARELNEAGAKMREAARTGVGKVEAEKELLLRALEHANYSLTFRGAQAQAARALAAFKIAAETTGTVSDLLRRSLNWSC